MAGVTIESEFRACVHCGLCLENCPTYVQLGVEMDSPRGRIVLMRGVLDGAIDDSAEVRRHVDQCLGCRACETACPSGVQYGDLLERFRGAVGGGAGRSQLLDYLLFNVFPDRRRLGRWLMLGRLSRAVGVESFMRELDLERRLPAWMRRLMAMLPADGKPIEPLAEHYPATGPARGSAAMFVGCVGEAIFGATNRATLRVLNRNGIAARCPSSQTCCGAIHAHGGRLHEAREMARRNVTAFAGDEQIVTNVAGCGAMLKEYGRLLADDAEFAAQAARFAARVRDVSEFLAGRLIAPPTGRTQVRVTYHDACHLCHAQGVRREPRELLRSIPGVELVELPESEMCCGAAGTYNLTQPDLSGELAKRKLACIGRTGAGVVLTGNAGCIMQIRTAASEAGESIEVMHPIDLLDRAYGGS